MLPFWTQRSLPHWKVEWNPHKQCFFFSRKIGQVTTRIIHFHYLKRSFLNQSIQKHFIKFWEQKHWSQVSELSLLKQKTARRECHTPRTCSDATFGNRISTETHALQVTGQSWAVNCQLINGYVIHRELGSRHTPRWPRHWMAQDCVRLQPRTSNPNFQYRWFGQERSIV